MHHPNSSKVPSEEDLPVPASVRCAVLIMYGGAMWSVIGTAAYIAIWYSQDYVPTTRPSFVHGDSGFVISGAPVVAWFIGFVGLVVFCLWLWMARMSVHGRKGVRIMATILLALQAFTLYGHYARHGGHRFSWTILVPVVSFLIGLTAVILLWRRSSALYFKATT